MHTSKAHQIIFFVWYFLFLFHATILRANNSSCNHKIRSSIGKAIIALKNQDPLSALAYCNIILNQIENTACDLDTSNQELIIDQMLLLADGIYLESGPEVYIYISNKLKALYQNATHLYYKRYQETKQRSYVKKFLNVIERNKATAVKLGQLNGNTKSRAQYESKRNFFRDQKQKISEQLAEENLRKLRTIEDSINTYTQKLNQLDDVSDLLKVQKSIEPSLIQGHLRRDEALIVYHEIDEHFYYSAVVTNNQIELNQHKSSVSFEILEANFQKSKRSHYELFTQTSGKLFQLLIEPSTSLVKSKRRIYVIKSGVINSIPLESLVSEIPKEANGNFHALNYLIHRHSFVYLNSLLQLTLSRSFIDKIEPKLLLVSPVFDEEMKLHFESIEKDSFYTAIPTIKSSPNFIQSLAEHYSIKTLTRLEASISTFKEVSHNYNFIHFDTHTFLDPSNQFNKSKICFSKELYANNQLTSGLLSLNDIYSLGYTPSVVVLGSCNTGNGTQKIGEGIVSIAYNFILLGSQNVIYSNWSIEETATHELFQLFYQQLEKKQPLDFALQQAKIKYLNNHSDWRSVQNAAPYYWAGLSISGKPLSMKMPKRNNQLSLIISFMILTILLVGFIYFFKRNNIPGLFKWFWIS